MVGRTLQQQESSILGGIKSLAGGLLGTTGNPGTKVSRSKKVCGLQSNVTQSRSTV